MESALDEPDPLVRLRALVVLMRVHAPRSVQRQWRTLRDLSTSASADSMAPVLRALTSQFEEATLMSGIAQEPPSEDWWRAEPMPNEDPVARFTWTIRAAGVTDCLAAVPRLRRLACEGSLRPCLAAERSLEEIDGPEADEALAACVERWTDQASWCAATALLDRNRQLLLAALLRSEPSESDLRLKGIFLARLDDPTSVPILCRAIGDGWGARISRDPEMFDAIERLARVEDLPEIERALERTSPFFNERRAREVLARVQTRLRVSR